MFGWRHHGKYSPIRCAHDPREEVSDLVDCRDEPDLPASIGSSRKAGA
jgi:hypothetical protein